MNQEDLPEAMEDSDELRVIRNIRAISTTSQYIYIYIYMGIELVLRCKALKVESLSCIVSRHERVVVVRPTYVLFSLEQRSPEEYLNIYSTTAVSRRLSMHLNDFSSLILHLKTPSIPKSKQWVSNYIVDISSITRKLIDILHYRFISLAR